MMRQAGMGAGLRSLAVFGIALALLAGGGLGSVPGLASEAGSDTAAGGLFDYRPPPRGAPAARIGGASRDLADSLAVEVLLPDHVAWTVSRQPVLYWFVSRPVTEPVEVSVRPADRIGPPILSTRIPSPQVPGIHALPLARHDVRLEADTVYHWSVAVVRDPARRDRDALARGALRRVPWPDGLVDRLAGRDAADKAGILAAAGIWVDGLQALAEAVTDGTVPAPALADVLDGQGLTLAARFARGG